MKHQCSLSVRSDRALSALVTNTSTVRLPSKLRRNRWTTEIFRTLLIAHGREGLQERRIVTYDLVNTLSLLCEKAPEKTGCKRFRPFCS
jgi:hypothetical protein